MATVYIAPTAQGLGDGTSAANAYGYSSTNLNSAETDAGNGGTILFLDGTYTLTGTQTWNAGGFSDMTYKSLNDNGAYLLGSGSMRQIYLGGTTVSTLKVEGFRSGNVYYRVVLNTNTVLTLNKINHADTISGTRSNFGIFAGGKLTTSNVITNSSFSLDYSGNDSFLYYATATTVKNCSFLIKCSSVGTGGVTSTNPPSTFKNTIFMSDNSSAINDSVIDVSNCTNCCVYQMHTNDSSGGTDNIFADPQFVDAPNSDLRLRPSSPCIGAATIS